MTAPDLSRLLRRVGVWPTRFPRTASVVLVVSAAMAAAAATHLPIDRLMLPSVAGLDVHAELPGIDAAAVELTVTTKLDSALASLPGIGEIESRTREGGADVRLVLRSGADLDRTLIVVRDRLSQTVPDLPRGMAVPVISLDHESDPPAVVYVITAAVLSEDLTRWVRNVLVDPLRELPGVGSVTMSGATQREIVIQPDPRRLVALGLSFDDIVDATRRSDVAPRWKRTTRALVPSGSAESIAARAVRLPGGESIALGELASVSIATAPETKPLIYKALPALRVEAFARHSVDAANVAERAQAHLAWLRANGLVPRGAGIHVLHDEARARAIWILGILQPAGICLVAILIIVATFFRARTVLYTTGAIAGWLALSLAALSLSGHTLNSATAAGLLLAAAPLTVLAVSRFEVFDMWRVAFTATIAWAAVLLLAPNALASAAFSIGLVVAVVVRWLLSPWLSGTAESPGDHGEEDVTADRVRRSTAFAGLVALLTLAATIAATFALPAGGATSGKFSFRMWGDDLSRLDAIATPLLVSLRVIPGVEHIAFSGEQEERWRLELDEERMEVVGVGLAEIGRAFAVANQGLVIGEIVDADRPQFLRLRLAPGAVGEAFERLPLRGQLPNRPAIYLRHVGIAEKVSSPRELIRVNGKTAVAITAYWSGAQPRADLENFCRRIEVPAGLASACSLQDLSASRE